MVMNIFVLIVLFLTMLAVAGVMGLGVFSMVKGGEFNKKNSNKIMKWRVYLQGLALALLALGFFLSQT